MIQGTFLPEFEPVANELAKQMDTGRGGGASVCVYHRALARVYAMLANGGVLDGERFLSESTVASATAVQSTKRDTVIGLPMRWRLGYHFVGTARGILPRAFGHFGYGGSGAWADPERNLAVAMILNRVAGTPLGDSRLLRIGGISVRCAERIKTGNDKL